MAASVKEVETCPLIHPSVRTGAPSPQGEGLWAVRNIPGRAGEGTRPYGMCRSILSFRRGRTLAGPRERQAPPLRRFACKWNGASGRPRPTNGEPSIAGGPMWPPLRRIKRRLRFSRRGRFQTGPPITDQQTPARQSQARLWNRTSFNFCKPRAQWPGGNLEQPLRFCAPEIFDIFPGTRPP